MTVENFQRRKKKKKAKMNKRNGAVVRRPTG